METPREIDERWMRVALREAEEARRAGEVPIGAVLVRGGEELARGHNAPIGTHDPTAHAEVVALRRAARSEETYRLPDTTLYATIEPCAMCLGAALHARVARIVYGAPDPKGGAAGTVVDLTHHPSLNHTIETTSGVLRDQAASLLQTFFRSRR